MVGFYKRYIARKQERRKQGYKYISNAIIKMCEEDNISPIGITSSIDKSTQKYDICRNICIEICENGRNVVLINADMRFNQSKNIKSYHEGFREISLVDFKVSELRCILKEEKDKGDIIIVNIPPVIVLADALEYAKVCENILLIERYSYSKYKDYEKTILLLKRSEVVISGAIACI